MENFAFFIGCLDEPIRKIIQYEGPYGQTYVRNIAEMNFKPSTFEKVGKSMF